MTNPKYLWVLCLLYAFNSAAQTLYHATSFETRMTSASTSQPLKTGFLQLDSTQSLTRNNKLLRKFDQRYLLNYQDTGVHLGICPLVNFSGGKDFNHSGRLFQNTRGILFLAKTKKFNCYALISENQARFSTYETKFIKSHGEFYPTSNGFNQQNGFIPGAARTKPFLSQAFDFAYARGEMSYSPNESVSFIGGNGSLFLGDGYRGLALSDVGNFPHLGFQLRISKHWQLLTLRGALFDLIRKPYYSGVESNYYTKAYSLQLLTFQTPKSSFGFFYQNIWSMGSVVRNQPVSSLFWIPIAGMDAFKNANASKPMFGVTFQTSINNFLSVYGQCVSRGFQAKGQGAQLGVKCHALHKSLLNLTIASEFNYTGESLYGNSFDLAFSNANLPMGSLVGNGTKEGVFILMMNYHRWALSSFTHIFSVGSPEQILLQPSYVNDFETVFQSVVELGFVVNQMSNLQVFTSYGWRNAIGSGTNSILNFGLKTKLFESHNAY